MLTWNAGADAVRTANRAVLSITDGGRSEDVELYLPQFRTGGVMYDPVTRDVAFRLTVDSDGAAETKESVRVIGWKRSAEAVELASAVQEPIPTGELAVTSTSPTTQPVFVAPAPAERPVRLPSISELPEIGTQASGAGSTFNPVPERLPAPPPPAPSRNPAEKRDPAAAAQIPAANAVPANPGPLRVASPRILRRTAILYPPTARQARVIGTVGVEVRIAADGRVIDATAISGPEMLRWIAAKGVKEWLFEPPVAGGKRVEAITRVDITFVP
jgi:outer membrane biosynthesis protein TonB